MDAASRDQILKTCREVLAPLVHADGGEIYVVSLENDEIHIHLAGTCAGCPGSALTRDRVVEPILTGVAPKLTVKLTTGWTVPAGAQKLD